MTLQTSVRVSRGAAPPPCPSSARRRARAGRAGMVLAVTVAIGVWTAAAVLPPATGQAAVAGDPFPVAIRVDAAGADGRARADLAVLRRRRAELRLHEGRPEAARANSGELGAEAGLLPRAQPAHHRRRHARAEVGIDRRLHARTPRATRSTTGRSSTGSSTPTWSAA